jgi:hypothetical protein
MGNLKPITHLQWRKYRMTTTQLTRISKALSKNARSGRGVSASRLSSLTKVPLDSVHKRIYDLRESGSKIISTFDVVKGQRRVFYRLVA